MVTMDTPQMTAFEAARRAGVTVVVATAADLPGALHAQHSGFDRVARTFGIDRTRMAPLSETLEDLRALHADGVVTFLARVGTDTVAGTVRGRQRDDGVIEIGRLAVADGFLRRGVATALMLALEESFPAASRFELYTGADASEPLSLYARLGYRIFRTEVHDAWQAVWLAKDRPHATAAADAPLHSAS